jgi:DNA-binding MarR family transcriptional regulator
MGNTRQELIDSIVEANRQLFHRYLQFGGGREWAEVDLTMPQLKVILVVAVSKGITMSHLARTVGMTLSTATGVADRLIAEGLVRRENDPSDRRLVLLHATDAGVTLVDRLTQIGRDQFELLARRLTIDDLRLVARASEVVFRAMLEAAQEQQPARASVD